MAGKDVPSRENEAAADMDTLIVKLYLTGSYAKSRRNWCLASHLRQNALWNQIGRIEIATDVKAQQTPFRQVSKPNRAQSPIFAAFPAPEGTKSAVNDQTGAKVHLSLTVAV
jgi:hypothetical protein